MIVLEMADGRLHGLAALEPASLLGRQRFGLAAMDDLDLWIVLVYPSKPQIHHDFLRTGRPAVQQDVRLLQLRREKMSVVRVSGETAGTHHQATAMGHRHTDFHTEFIRLAGLALARSEERRVGKECRSRW